MSIEDARSRLCLAAVDYAAQRKSSRDLEAAAREFATACMAAATGVTAAAAQLKRDERRGVRLCPSCSEPVLPSHDRSGVVWLNRNFTPHRCHQGDRR